MLDGGKLTAAEKRSLNHQDNRVGNQIYQDKHNAAQQRYGNNKVDERRENQQDRIANGIASGKLNAAQTSRLEKGQNQANRKIYKDKH